MNQRPLRISIITPSFNQAQFIERTVQSVVCQRGNFELEYRVLDGGSTDGSQAILERYADRLSFISEKDHGQIDAINKGLRAATGDVVAWLNSDDVLAQGAIQRVVDAFTARPDVEWVHGRCNIIDIEDREIRRWISHYKHWCAQRYSYARLLTENFVSQMTVFFRRSALDEIGYLDGKLDLAFDYDLWLRLARRSDPFYIGDLQASFRWYDATKSGSSFERQIEEDYAIAGRYAEGRRGIMLLKRFKSMRTAAIYRGMRFVRQGIQQWR